MTKSSFFAFALLMLMPAYAASEANCDKQEDEVSMLQTFQQVAARDAGTEADADEEDGMYEDDEEGMFLEKSNNGGIDAYAKKDGDCFGNDLTVSWATGLDACAALCDGEEACEGFSFHEGVQGCITKSAACDNPAEFAGWIFYEKPSAPEVAHNTPEMTCPSKPKCVNGFTKPCMGKSPGPYMSKLTGIGKIGGCKNKCKATGGCKAIIYHEKTKVCFLLKRKYGGKYEPTGKGHFVSNKCR